MPLARTYIEGKVISTAHDGYLDKLTRESDILEYLPLLHEIALSYEHPRILELGARKGNSTLAFLAAVEVTGGHVTSVDIDPVPDNPAGMLPWKQHPQWTFIQGDDMDRKILFRLPLEVDVLFIDTSHAYDHTLRELEEYMPRVAPGGIALFHDTKLYIRDGLFILEKGDDNEIAPVARALNEYCEENGITWEEVPGEYGMGIIRA